MFDHSQNNFQAMGQSPNYRLLHSAELCDGLAAALWSNHNDTCDYQARASTPCPATWSGDTGTFRRERPDCKGTPDLLKNK
jgi:AraC family transcriptional regulator